MAEGKLSKRSTKDDAKGSVAISKESIQLGCLSQDSYPRKSVLRESGKLGSKHAVKFSQVTWHQKKIREGKGPSRGIIQKCAPHERSPYAPKFGERSLEEFLHQERCARRVALDLANNFYKLQNSDRTTFHTNIEAKGVTAPTSKRPEELEFVVDSGASLHMMIKKQLSSEEMDTVKRSRTPAEGIDCRRRVHTHEVAQVFVHDLNLFVTVQPLEETPAVLSLGKLCEDHGYSYEWVSGQKPRLTKDGNSIICKTDNFVLHVVPGLSENSENVTRWEEKRK